MMPERALERKKRLLLDAAMEYAKSQQRVGAPNYPPFACPDREGGGPCQKGNSYGLAEEQCIHCGGFVRKPKREPCALCEGDGIACSCCRRTECVRTNDVRTSEMMSTPTLWEICFACLGEG